MRHIVVKTKAKADELYAQLEDGADFAKLAKANSTDKGSAKNGGKLPVQKGTTVAPFDKVAFELETNEISKPVKTTFGWHIIMPISDVKAEQDQPLDDISDSIAPAARPRRRRTRPSRRWLKELEEKYPGRVRGRLRAAPSDAPDRDGGTAPAETSGATTAAPPSRADTLDDSDRHREVAPRGRRARRARSSISRP